MNKTIYIGGKVSGLPQAVVMEKFNRAADRLAAEGHQVVKPAIGNDWETAIRDNIKNMLSCDEVHLLPCWQHSRGAQIERDIAIRLGMNVVYY